jgi:murein L,D-transpeptidase YcbB/YkuD
MINIQKILIIILLSTGLLFATTTNVTHIELKSAFKTSPSKLLKNIPQKKFLKSFYRKNKYTALWLETNKFNKNKYTKLFQHIQNDITLNQKGLIYKNYQTLEKQLDTNLTQEQMLHIEIKLSSLYYNFLIHTVYGEIQWKKFAYKLSSLKKRRINGAWVKSKPKFNITKIMNSNNIDMSIQELTPKNFGYKGLLLALNKLETLKKKGTWEELPYFKRLALGSTGDIVLKLRSRLQVSGDYKECNETNTSTVILNDHNLSSDLNLSRDAVFGSCLDKAVKTFQQRHGLMVDGIVGGGTRKALNISIDEKIRKIRLNIDRIKWLPREEQERFLVVNIPEFMLHYIEDGETKQKLRVIVGDKKHPTPIFSQKISYIVLNPYWKVPEGIVKREIVPAMVKNPNYLRKQGLVAHRTWDENSRIIDTSWLYWEDYLYGQKKFPYRLMQPPGPRNALGKIKFKFPNRFAVYLHDTPTRHLFKRNVRAFSHGCVRLSNPRELLETIATFNTNIDIRKAKKVLKGKRKKQLGMKEKLRIYIVYLTAGMNEKGQIEFRNDIYNYDKYQKRRLR